MTNVAAYFQQNGEKFQQLCWKNYQKIQNNILPEAKTYYVKEIYFIINIICIIYVTSRKGEKVTKTKAEC